MTREAQSQSFCWQNTNSLSSCRENHDHFAVTRQPRLNKRGQALEDHSACREAADSCPPSPLSPELVSKICCIASRAHGTLLRRNSVNVTEWRMGFAHSDIYLHGKWSS